MSKICNRCMHYTNEGICKSSRSEYLEQHRQPLDRCNSFYIQQYPIKLTMRDLELSGITRSDIDMMRNEITGNIMDDMGKELKTYNMDNKSFIMLKVIISKQVISRMTPEKIKCFFENSEKLSAFDLKWLAYGSKPIGHKKLNKVILHYLASNNIIDVLIDDFVTILSASVHEKLKFIQENKLDIDNMLNLLPC